MVGSGKRFIGAFAVAKERLDADIVWHFVPNRRRTLVSRFCGVGNTRQRFVIYDNGFGGVFRLRARVGHDDGQCLSDISGLVRRQWHMVADKDIRSAWTVQLHIMFG